MATQQVVPVTCPNCGARFTAPVQEIIDGQDPAQKSAFLQGRMNVVQCPSCGFSSPLEVPTLYHDAGQELALVYVPGGLQVTNAEQEKMIGALTNKLMNNLPAEQRKFYMFNPKVFLTLESLMKAVLEADGITEEVLEAQRAKVKLIEEFMQVEDEKTLKAKVKEHDAELDREFFEILTASIQAAQMEGNSTGAQTLFALRTLLARWSTQGRQAIKEIDEELGLMFLQNQEELLERLQNATTDKEFETLVAAGHALLDYTFFQQLTARIDQTSSEGNIEQVEKWKDLRTRILDVKAKHEEVSRAALKKSAELLKEILQSHNPEKVLEQKLDKIDPTFFIVLSANIEEARRQKQEQVAQAMEMIGNRAMAILQARLAPAQETDKSTATSEILVSNR